jgi:hypothetical protein
MDEKSEKKYGVTMLFPKDTDIKALKKIAKDVIKDKWPKGKPKNLRSPFRKGEEKPNLEGYENVIFISAKSQRKPKLVDQRKQPVTDPDRIYPGIWLRAVVNAFTYTTGQPGVAFALQHLQIVKDDDSFYGGGDPNEDFDELETDVEDIEDDDLFDDNDSDNEDDDFGV